MGPVMLKGRELKGELCCHCFHPPPAPHFFDSSCIFFHFIQAFSMEEMKLNGEFPTAPNGHRALRPAAASTALPAPVPHSFTATGAELLLLGVETPLGCVSCRAFFNQASAEIEK